MHDLTVPWFTFSTSIDLWATEQWASDSYVFP